MLVQLIAFVQSVDRRRYSHFPLKILLLPSTTRVDSATFFGPTDLFCRFFYASIALGKNRSALLESPSARTVYGLAGVKFY